MDCISLNRNRLDCLISELNRCLENKDISYVVLSIDKEKDVIMIQPGCQPIEITVRE